MWVIFKVFIEITTELLCLYVVAIRHVDISSQTRDWTGTPCIGRWSLNHWTTREVPSAVFKADKWLGQICISDYSTDLVESDQTPTQVDLGHVIVIV